MVNVRIGIAQLLRGGIAAALELSCLFAAGAAAAALLWAILDPVGVLPAGPEAPRVAAAHAPALPGGDPFLRESAPDRPVARAAGNDYVLHATLVSADGGGSAILSAPGLPQASYSTGDIIDSRARLAAVAQDHVEIEQDGSRRRIAFTASGGPLVQSGTVAPQKNDIASPGRAELVNAMSLRRVERSGQNIGMEVFPRDPAILKAAGLYPGDVIIAVNGALLTAETLASVHDTLISGAAIELRIERAGSVHSLSLGSTSP